MRFDYLAVLVPLGVVLALLVVMLVKGMPKQAEQDLQTAAAFSKGRQDSHPPNLHTRPTCDDSSLFRAEVDGVIRSCKWVNKNPAERCGTAFGTDNNGNHVFAKDACYRACDTGNCRRRGLGETIGLVEGDELN